MNASNYLNIKEKEKESYIYRIIKVEHLYALFEQCHNVLVNPMKWEDPFENFILKSSVRLPTGEERVWQYHNSFFGQCWTLHKASDAMWRIYSSGSCECVRIRTTVRTLASSLWKACGSDACDQAYIGRVSYLYNRAFIRFANNALHLPLKVCDLAHTLLVKRPAFRHEKEIRLLANINNRTESDLFHYRVSPHELIDQLMVDPRLKPREAKSFIEAIRKRTGFSGDIKRSLLYTLPDGLVFPLNVTDRT